MCEVLLSLPLLVLLAVCLMVCQYYHCRYCFQTNYLKLLFGMSLVSEFWEQRPSHLYYYSHSHHVHLIHYFKKNILTQHVGKSLVFEL